MPNKRLASPAVTKRIAASVQASERRRAYRGEAQRPRYFARPGEIRTVVVSAAIGARAGDNLGTGKVKLCNVDESAHTVAVSTDPADEWTVWNPHATAFGVDLVKRGRIHFEGGLWLFDGREC